MALLSGQNVAPTGLSPSYSAAAGGGDSFFNDGRTFLHVKNGGGGSINVTIDANVACNIGTEHDLVVAVPNGQERMIGPFPTNRFLDTVNITYSGVTSVTIAAIRF